MTDFMTCDTTESSNMQHFSLVYQISKLDSGEIPRCNRISRMDGTKYLISHLLTVYVSLKLSLFKNSPLAQLSLEVVMHDIITVVITVSSQQKVPH